MTEKRPTPDPSAGKGRRKRMAPTIDLTATEIPPEISPVTSEADPPPPPEAAAPEAEAAPQPEPPPATPPDAPDEPRKSVRSALTMPVLAAGLAGAAVMSAILLTMWLTGLLPIRFAGLTMTRARVAALEMQLQELQKRPAPSASSSAADTKIIEALNQRLAKMEESLTKVPVADPAKDTALADRIAAVAATSALARERAESAEKAVADLRASVQDVSKTANAGASSADLAPLQQRIVTLEQTARTASEEIAKASASDTAARRALSAALLRDSVLRGAPFTAELAQARALGAEAKSTSAFEGFATTGLPTRATLALELQPIITGLRTMSQSQASDGSFIERLQANAGKLVRISPVDAPPGDDAGAVLSRLEAAAARADIPAAIVELAKLRRPDLTDYERSPQFFWITKAKAREAAAAAVQAFATDAARSLGSK